MGDVWHRKKYIAIAAFVFLTPLWSLLAFRAVRAQDQCRLFSETGKTVCGRFLRYWHEHGGVTLQGFPISDPLQETSEVDGKTYQVQYFERALFELHDENSPPYDILLSLLGTSRYLEYYGPDGAGIQYPDPINPRFFIETDHTLGGRFRSYWEQHGGLSQFGFPISDEFIEVSNIDGKPYTVQYFQRALFELHPENQGSPYEVLLAQLGTYRFRAVYGSLSIPKPIPPATRQIDRTASQAYLLWIDAQRPMDTLPVGPRSDPISKWVLNLYSNRAFTTTLDTDLTPYLGKDGPYVVWMYDCSSRPLCNQEVYVRNLLTGDTYPIDDHPDYDRDAVVAGSTAAYVNYELSHGRLVVKNLALGTSKVIAPYAVVEGEFPYLGDPPPQISSEYVVYVQSWTTSGPPRYGLYAYNLKTGDTRVIAQHMGSLPPPGDMHIALSGHFLAWTDPALHLTNLNTGETKVIFDQPAFFVALRGNTLVWNAFDSGDSSANKGGQIWGTRLSSLRPGLIFTSRSYPWQPIIAGDWLIWPGLAARPDDLMSAISLDKAFADTTPSP